MDEDDRILAPAPVLAPVPIHRTGIDTILRNIVIKPHATPVADHRRRLHAVAPEVVARATQEEVLSEISILPLET